MSTPRRVRNGPPAAEIEPCATIMAASAENAPAAFPPSHLPGLAFLMKCVALLPKPEADGLQEIVQRAEAGHPWGEALGLYPGWRKVERNHLFSVLRGRGLNAAEIARELHMGKNSQFPVLVAKIERLSRSKSASTRAGKPLGKRRLRDLVNGNLRK
jgi:hypothetical protein